MFKQLNILSKKRFVRNVFIVATGTAGAQAITMAFSPIITRLYGPEAFGLLGTFMAILAVAIPISALTYPIAIVLPKSDEDAKGIARLSARIAFVMAALLAAIILLTGEKIARLLNVTEISSFLLLIPLAMFFSALQQIMQQWLIRKKQFRVTARIAVTQSLIINLSKAGAGFYNPIGAVLIVIATLGNALYAVQLWLGALRWASEGGRITAASSGDISLKKLAYLHRDFPCYRAPQAFLNAVSQSLPVLLLVLLFGPAAAGYFSLSKSILGAPAYLIGSSVGNVFYPKVTEMVNRKEDPTKLLIKSTAGIMLVVTAPFGFVFLFGPWIFGSVFGTQWSVAGEYAQWMSIWLVMSVAVRPALAMIPVLDMQKELLFMEVFFSLLKVAAFFYGFAFFNSSVGAVAFYSIASSVFYAGLFSAVLLKTKALFG